MARNYPETLQAALLFNRTCPMQFANLNWPKLKDQLNTHLANETGLTPIDSLGQNKPEKSVTMGNGAFHIVIAAHTDVLETDTFSGVLRSPFYAKMQPGLIDAVKSHEAHIMITVGLGDTPSLGEDFDQTGVPKVHEDQPMFEARLRLTKIISFLLNQASPGGTVYWGQSEQLYTSAAFATIAQHRFPLTLFIHPLFHASGASKRGQVLAGIKGLGSQHVLGKPLVFAEHTQPMMQSYVRLLEFAEHCRSIGHVMQDGARFGDEPSEQITVRHHPATPKDPTGCIELVLIDPEIPNPASRKGNPDEAAVLRNAFLGRTNTPVKTDGLPVSNALPALLRKISAMTNLALRPGSKARLKNN